MDPVAMFAPIALGLCCVGSVVVIGGGAVIWWIIRGKDAE